MAGLVPAIPIKKAERCHPKRDARHKAGHDKELLLKLRHDFHVIGITELIDRRDAVEFVATIN